MPVTSKFHIESNFLKAAVAGNEAMEAAIALAVSEGKDVAKNRISRAEQSRDYNLDPAASRAG